VIRQHAVGKELDRIMLEALLENRQKCSIIPRSQEDRGFSYASIDDVEIGRRGLRVVTSGHGKGLLA